MIISIGAVSASENITDTNTFEEIQTKVNSANDTDTIMLDGYYSGTSEISISKSLTIQGSSNETVLDGLNISRAFNVKNGEVTFKNLEFRNCIYDYGGAVYSEGSCIFIDCRFIDNHAVNGGAIYSYGSLECINSTFTENTAGSNGGSIYSYISTSNTASKNNPGNVNIKDCQFNSNYAGSGGSVIYTYVANSLKNAKYGNVNIENCNIINNTCPNYGAVLFVSQNEFARLTVKKSNFNHNTADEGAGICFSDGKLYVYDSNFTDNKAKLGAVNVMFTENALIQNSCFINNTADSISAVSVSFYSSMTLKDCKFQNNSNGVVNVAIDSELILYNNNKKTTYSSTRVFDNSLKAVTPIKVTADNLVSTYYSQDSFTVLLTNAYTGKPVDNFMFTVKCVSDKKTLNYHKTSNSNGKATVKLSRYFPAGKYKVTFVSEDWSSMKSSSITITVKKAKTTVKAPKVVNKYKKSEYFTVTVKNAETKKPVDYTYVKVKVYTGKNFKTYKIKTNSKGVAKLNTKNLKKGTHKVIIESGSGNYIMSKNSQIKIK